MPSKLIESTRMNVPSFLPNLLANAEEPGGYWESSALAGFNTLMQQRQVKSGASRWSIETITEEPELLHCDMTDTLESCHFIRIDFWKDEIVPLSVVTIKDPTFDDIEPGDMVTLRNSAKYVVKAALVSPDDMIGDYHGLIHLDGLEPMAYVHSLLYLDEDTLDDRDIVELTRTPQGLEPEPPAGKVFHYEAKGGKRLVTVSETVNTAQISIDGRGLERAVNDFLAEVGFVFDHVDSDQVAQALANLKKSFYKAGSPLSVNVGGSDLEDACEVLRTNGFEYEEGADYWFKRKPVGELKDGNVYRVVWTDSDDEHYDWQVGDLCVVEESNEETSYCRNIENDTVVSWLDNAQLEWYAEKE